MPAQYGIPNATREHATLLPYFEQGSRRAYERKPTVYNLLKARGRFKKAESFVHRAFIETGPAGVAGFRVIRDRIPGQSRNIGGSEIRLATGSAEIQIFLTTVYAGLSDDGLLTEAARNGKEYVDHQKVKYMNMVDEVAWKSECAIVGDGTGRLAEISSISGTSVTLKGATGTVALAGQEGTELIRYPRQVCIAVDPSTGTKRSIGGTRGVRIDSVTASTRVIVTSRDMSGAGGWAANDIIVEGDDDADSYNNVPLGLKAIVGNATDRTSLFGLRRNKPGNEWLSAHRVDAQASSALGEYNPATVAAGLIDANRLNPGKTPLLLVHPKLLQDAEWGALIEGGNPTTRTIQGPHAQRRWMDDGARMAGNTGAMTIGVPGFGKAELMAHWAVQPNNIYGIDPTNFEIIQYQEGLTSVDQDSAGVRAVRETHYDTVHRAFRKSFNFLPIMPNRGSLRVVNVLQAAGN